MLRASAVCAVTDSPWTGDTAAISVNGATTYQTIDGLGFALNPGAWDGGALEPILDQLVNDIGATSFAVFIEEADWEATNDDGSPSTQDWTDYDAIYSNTKFENLWNTIAYLNSLGITDRITITVVGQAPSWLGSNPLNTDTSSKNEWAEMIATMCEYGLSRRSPTVQFGGITPTNEQDWSPYEGVLMVESVYADCLERLRVALNAFGLTSLRIDGPDCAQLHLTETYINAVAANAPLLARFTHVLAHDYTGSTGSVPSYAAAVGKPWGMSELGFYDEAFGALGAGASIVRQWEPYDSVYLHAARRGDGTDPGNDQGTFGEFTIAPFAFDTVSYTRRDEFYQWCQLFRHVQPGAQRVAVTADAGLTALAFKGPSSGVTITGKNTGGEVQLVVSLASMPSATALEVYVTDGGAHQFTRLADAPLSGGEFKAVVPANCFYTLTAGVS